jgi:hypothetical protein
MSENQPWTISNFKIVIDVTGHPWASSGSEQNSRYTRNHANDLLRVIQPMAEALSEHYASARIEGEKVCKFCGHNWYLALDENGSPICCEAAMNAAAEKETK